MSELTFGDLWKSLDWSAAEEEEATWDADNPSEYTHTDDFKQRLRMTYLEQSLWGETKELRQEARSFLNLAGVWTQVVAYLHLHNVWEEEHDDRPDTPDGASDTPAGPITENGCT